MLIRLFALFVAQAQDFCVVVNKVRATKAEGTPAEASQDPKVIETDLLAPTEEESAAEKGEPV